MQRTRPLRSRTPRVRSKREDVRFDIHGKHRESRGCIQNISSWKLFDSSTLRSTPFEKLRIYNRGENNFRKRKSKVFSKLFFQISQIYNQIYSQIYNQIYSLMSSFYFWFLVLYSQNLMKSFGKQTIELWTGFPAVSVSSCEVVHTSELPRSHVKIEFVTHENWICHTL